MNTVSTGWTDRQIPAGDEIFLDHVGFFVADLDDAGRRLERLGFQVSQINVQTNADVNGALTPSGTSNRLARLKRGYLEVLAATHTSPLADQLTQALTRYEGIHLVALSHDDIPTTRARLVAEGFGMQPVVHLRRRDKTLPGEPEVAWSVLRPQPGVMPEGRIQFAKSHNPDRVWQEELTRHANGAEALTDLLFCVADRDEAAARFGRYARAGADLGRFKAIVLDRGRLLFVDRKGLATLGLEAPALPFIAGQALRVSDITRTRALLAERKVTPIYAGDGLILVGHEDALGSTLLFHAADVSSPWSALAERR
jgi:hypothetical protein